MENALERALDGAECVIESARHRPPKRKQPSSGEKSLHDKLYDLYVEECGKEPEVTEELISNVNLLEKLLQRESLPCLVVSLYPGKQGYSLMLKGPSDPHSETIRLPYEERKFLDYLDAEELPPALVDLLEKSGLNIFHRGCVIAEVRDYRQGSHGEPPGYQSRHVLLRPTMQTLACDVQSITSDNQEWTQEDKLLLESQLILATAEPLCLDPSVSVACTANRLLYNRQKMNTPAMRRNFNRYPTASQNEQQELSCSPAPHKKSKESQATQQDNLNIFKAGNCVDVWNQRPCDLAVPSEVDMEKYASEVRSVKYDDSPLTVWPAYRVNDDISLFGYEDGDRSQTTELTFMQSLGDPLISGQRSPKKARCERQMSPCHSFRDDHCYSLMPESNIDTGEVQSLFEELEPLSAECAFQVSPGSSGSGSFIQLSPEKEAAQPLDMSVQSSVVEEGVQYTPPPISLLSSSGKSSSGSDNLTPEQESSFHKLVSPDPAPKPPGLPQKSSVEVNCFSTLPTAALCTASSAQTTPASQVKAKYAGPNFIKVAIPVPAALTVVRGSNSMKGFTARTRTPVPIKPKVPCSEDQHLPHIRPAVQQAPSQGIQFILKNVSEVRPITLLQLAPGTLILNTQQQSQQQPQQKPQQQPWQPQQQPRQLLQQLLQQPQQVPQQPPWQQLHQQPQLKPRQQPQQPQLKPRQQPQQPQLKPWQQPQQPQLKPWQPQLKPRQQPQQPQLKPRQQPQQPQLKPRQPQPKPWQPQLQPRQQPQQLQLKPQQQPRQPQLKPRQPQLQPQQQPQQPQLKPRQQPRQPQLKPRQPQLQPQQQPQQPQLKPRQQPRQPQLKPQQPQLKPRQPQLQPRQPQLQPRQQPQQLQLKPRQQPRQPQLKPQQPQLKPRQPQLLPRQQPQQPQLKPRQQPQQPQLQLRQQPQQPQSRQQPQQLQLQPRQQPQQLQLQPGQQPQQLQLQPRQQPQQLHLQPRQQPQQLQLQLWQQPQQLQLQLWQQPQQLQLHPWQQPQQFYQLIPQLQQPICHIQQSVSQHSSVQRVARRRMILPAQKTPIPNPKRLGSNLQPQRAVGSQLGSTQTRPGQSHPQQRVQLPSAFQQQPQPQQAQLRILQLPMPMPTVATQRSQPHHGQNTASQSKGISHSDGLQQKSLHSQNSKTTLKNKKINH